jgi:hypothetical protein
MGTLPPSPQDLSLPAIPVSIERRGDQLAPAWSGPSVSAQVASLRSLIPAEVSTSVTERIEI